MEEFGLSPEEYERILGRIEQCLDTAENSPEDFPALQGVIDKISEMENKKPEIPDYRKDPNYQMIYEKHGWENVKKPFLVISEKSETHME